MKKDIAQLVEFSKQLCIAYKKNGLEGSPIYKKYFKIAQLGTKALENPDLDILLESSPFKMKQLWVKIQNLKDIRTPLEEQQNSYLATLQEFQTLYSDLTPESQADWTTEIAFVNSEIARIQGQRGLPENPQQQVLEDNLTAATAGRIYRITTGILNDGRTVGRLEYIGTSTVPNGPVIVHYWSYITTPDGNTEYKRIGIQNRISGELAIKLVSMANSRGLVPAPTDANGESNISIDTASMFTQTGNWAIATVEAAQLCLPFIQIEDSQPRAIKFNACNKPIEFEFQRTVRQIPNPNCILPQVLNYIKILRNNQETKTAIYISDSSNNNGLPPSALRAESFQLNNINNYFAANPERTEYKQTLTYNIPEPPIPLLYEIKDTHAVPILDNCNNIIRYTAIRTVTPINNPKCLPQKLLYTHIMSVEASRINPPFSITDGEGINLPKTAKGFDTEQLKINTLNKYFEANPEKAKLEISLQWNLAVPPTVGSINIGMTYWTAKLDNPSKALITLQPLLDYLRFNCNAQIEILGNYDLAGLDPVNFNPLTRLFTPAERANGIPTSIVNPVDYIFVKGQAVANFILAQEGILPSQIVVPARSSLSTARINARIFPNNASVAQQVEITIIND